MGQWCRFVVVDGSQGITAFNVVERLEYLRMPLWGRNLQLIELPSGNCTSAVMSFEGDGCHEYFRDN